MFLALVLFIVVLSSLDFYVCFKSCYALFIPHKRRWMKWLPMELHLWEEVCGWAVPVWQASLAGQALHGAAKGGAERSQWINMQELLESLEIAAWGNPPDCRNDGASTLQPCSSCLASHSAARSKKSRVVGSLWSHIHEGRCLRWGKTALGFPTLPCIPVMSCYVAPLKIWMWR